MNKSISLRRLLLAPPNLRTALLPRSAPPSQVFLSIHHQRTYAVQSVTSPSFWSSLVPKPLRRDKTAGIQTSKRKAAKSKEWNPATFFIIIFMLIGSMSVQMIALRNSHAAFSRRADAKIGLLREIIERINKGEEVDVEGLLGTGDEKREKEWEDVLKEIEEEDNAWENSQRSKPKHGRNLEESKRQAAQSTVEAEKSVQDAPKGNAPPGFY